MLVKVRAVALNPIDLYMRSGFVAMPLSFPYIIGCDLAGTVEKVGPGCARFKVGDRVWGSNQGLLGRQGVAAEFAAVDEGLALSDARHYSPTEAAGDGAGRHHGPPRAVPVRPAQERRDGLCPRRQRRRRLDGRPDGQGRRGQGRHLGRQPEQVELCRELGADLALNYKTDDIPARLREFAPEGVDVWYETQREPNLEVSIPLLRKRGRMILMAGRTAKPILPLGAFYPRELLAPRLRHVQRHARRATPCCRRHHPLDRGRAAQAARRPRSSPSKPPRTQRFLEENYAQGRTALSGKSSSPSNESPL